MLRTRIMTLLAVLLIASAAFAQEEAGETAEPTQDEQLIEAIQDGGTRDVSRLLTDGANANAMTEMGVPALSYAAFHGNKDIVKALIEAGADVGARDQASATPLMFAALNGDAEQIQMLLEAGADINAKDSSDWTPLMKAVAAGKADATRALVEAGADVNAKNRLGRSATEMAEFAAIEEVVAAIRGETPAEQ